MVNSSAMTEPTVVVSGDQGPELSFSEILQSSPPPSSNKAGFLKEVDVKSSQSSSVRRQSSRVGLFGRFANTRLRNSVLKRDGAEDRGRSNKVTLAGEASQRQSSLPAMRAVKHTAGSQQNPSLDGDDEEPTPRASIATHTKERLARMTIDPPPLGSAFSQSIKHGPVMAPSGSVEAILRAHRTNDHGRKPTLEPSLGDKRPSTPGGGDTYAAKLYVLTTSGYLLQYTREGSYDRLPERIMQLTKSSAAMACDLIPGRHWVLRVSASFGDEAATHYRPRFGLSKLGLGSSTKLGTQNFLLIMDSADELDAWLVALRREIQSLGGADYKPDVTDQRTLKERLEDSVIESESVIQKPASLAVQRPVFNRATSAPERVATHRITNSMAKHGLLLRMDESESEVETEVTFGVPNSQAQQHGHTDATSPQSAASINDSSSHRSKLSTDTAASKSVPTGRRSESQNHQPGQAQYLANDLDSVIESIIPRHPGQTNAGSHGRKQTGLRKKALSATTQSTSPLTDASLSATTQSSRSSLHPPTSGFKTLSPLANYSPIVLTPPASPEFNLRPRSLSMLENETAPVISPGSVLLQSPISDPGMLSPREIPTGPEKRSPRSPKSMPRSGSTSTMCTNDHDRKDSTGGSISDHQSKGPTGWIPPRHSSLLYSQGVLPSSGTSSGRTTPSSARKDSVTPVKTEKLKLRLAALDVANIPAANVLHLTPSPHPPPTGALPELPKARSPAPSRPGSRQDQSRQLSLGSLVSDREIATSSDRKDVDAERASSVASLPRMSDAQRKSSVTDSRRPSHPERTSSTTSVHDEPQDNQSNSAKSTNKSIDSHRAAESKSEVSVLSEHSSSPREQTTPRKARVGKVILPPMSQVPATRPSLPMHPSVGPPPNLTVAERRRRRSPSPIHSRGRSGSNAEKVLSAISEMTEASDAATIRERRVAMDGMITIGLEVPAEEHEFQQPASVPALPSTKPAARLMPNGVPNPLAGNPVRTPDMRMIPHQPTREPPPPPPSLDDLHPPVPPKDEDDLAPVAKETERTQEMKRVAAPANPLGRKLSMRERAAAAIAAARPGTGQHKHEGKERLDQGLGDVRDAHQEDAKSSMNDSDSTIPPYKRTQSLDETGTKVVFHERSSSLEHRIARTQTQFRKESETNISPDEAPKPPPPAVSDPAPSENQSDRKLPRPTSAMEKEVFLEGSQKLPHRPPKHIAELLFIPELPAEPCTPPPPEMKASITAFGQDEFDMWEFPAGTPKSAASEFAPLQLDLGDEQRNARPSTSGARVRENREQPRWSLFNAIEGIQ